MSDLHQSALHCMNDRCVTVYWSCDVISGSTCTRVLEVWMFFSASKSGICRSPYMWECAVVFSCVHYSIILTFIYLFICSSTHISTIRQVLKQDSKAQTCTDSYPKITENPVASALLASHTPCNAERRCIGLSPSLVAELSLSLYRILYRPI